MYPAGGDGPVAGQRQECRQDVIGAEHVHLEDPGRRRHGGGEAGGMHQGPELPQCPDGAGQIVDGRANRHINWLGDDVQSIGLQFGCAVGETRGVLVCDHQLATGPEPAGAGHAHPSDPYDNDDLPHSRPSRRPTLVNLCSVY